MTNVHLSRRRLLRGVAAGAAATGMAGKVTANEADGHIVGLKAGAGFDVARRRADSVKAELDWGRIGKAVAGQFSEQALEALESNPQVRYVEPDGRVQALSQTVPWGIERVGGDVLHANGETGAGSSIAIIDTGIDQNHDDLAGNLVGGEDFTGTGSWDDDNGHGTHCAGTANAIDNDIGVVGVATEADMYGVKVLDSSGGGTWSGVASGIEWTADQGIDVGSLSLGGSSSSSTLQDACQYAHDKGTLLVAAAGNSGPCSDCVGYPAAYDTVVAVSSTTSSDSLSSFSSTGPEVELAAPGSSVYSTYPPNTYDTLSGTSMACPHVSGAASQLMANGYTSTQARTRLQETAEDIGLSSNEQGYGLLDAEAAVLGDDDDDDDDDDGGDDGDCVDASNWPSGTGYNGFEYLTQVDMDGQVVETSSSDAYYDFTCPDVVYVEQGGSFDVAINFEDAGYNSHYGNVFVDWDQNQDWSTATETQVFENVSDDSVTYTATVDVPENAPTGGTLARVRLSYNGFDGPTATGEYGEVNDFTVYVVEDDGGDDEECADASNWPAGTGSSGFENLDQVNLDGQVVETSAENAYEDFTCPDVVTVSPGSSFQIAVDFSDGGYDNHYGNVFIDWDQNEDWSTASETQIFENVSDDSTTYTATVNVPSNAQQGATLARVRLGWNSFDGPSDTGTYGEVNDFTIYVE